MKSRWWNLLNIFLSIRISSSLLVNLFGVSVTAVTTHRSGELSPSIRSSALIARPPSLQTTLLTAGRQTEDSYAHMHMLTFVGGGDVGVTARQGGVARWVWNRPLWKRFTSYEWGCSVETSFSDYYRLQGFILKYPCRFFNIDAYFVIYLLFSLIPEKRLGLHFNVNWLQVKKKWHFIYPLIYT